ncbi:hypothetical protein BGP_5842 [Beggiatoa sp. PS]|nr:hypothetical protein BGP_5842 [Beggiatoa sp. PS]
MMNYPILGKKMRNLLFSDSDIKEGNSGCPIIKGDQVIAVMTSVTDFAYAISAETVRDFVVGAKGGEIILSEMERWDSATWHQEYEARSQNFKEKIKKTLKIEETLGEALKPSLKDTKKPGNSKQIKMPLLQKNTKLIEGERSLYLAWQGGKAPYKVQLYYGDNILNETTLHSEIKLKPGYLRKDGFIT